MAHLTDEQFVDAAEGDIGPETAAHLASCAVCASRVDEMRVVLDAVAEVPASEPSPRFWEHFGARVSAAIDAPARPPWLLTRPAGWLTAAAILIVCAIGVYALGTAPRMPWSQTIADTSTRPEPAPPSGEIAAAVDPEPSDDDAWAVVQSLAGDLHYDDALEAGIRPRAGAIERAATELSAEERAELVRLIEHELRRSGA